MTKIIWLLKKAEHLTTEEFQDWWLNSHAPHARQAPGLRRYVINFARPVDDLAGRPTWWFHPLGIESKRAATLKEIGRRATRLAEWSTLPPGAAWT